MRNSPMKYIVSTLFLLNTNSVLAHGVHIENTMFTVVFIAAAIFFAKPVATLIKAKIKR